MKAIVKAERVAVYVRDLEPGDLVKLFHFDHGPKLYEVDSIVNSGAMCGITFKEKMSKRVGRRWLVIPRYELRPIVHNWSGDNIVTVERRERIEV